MTAQDAPESSGDDDEWSQAGHATLRWLVAEALAAFEVWRNLPVDSSVTWANAHGWDLELNGPDGLSTRINVKRAWRRGVKDGFLAYGGPVEPDPEKAGLFALVHLEDVSLMWSATEDQGVKLEVLADRAPIYFLSVEAIRQHASWDGKARSRALIPDHALEGSSVLPPLAAMGSPPVSPDQPPQES